MTDFQRIETALSCIDSDMPRDEWSRIAMALKSELPNGEGFALFDAWSKHGSSYNKADCRSTWRSVRPYGPVSIASLFFAAKQAGWRADNSRTVTPSKRREKHKASRLKADERAEILRTKKLAQKIWALTTPAPENHPYLVRKQIQPNGIGLLGPESIYLPKRVRNDGNVLVVPKRGVHSDQVVSVQFISNHFKAYLPGRQPKGAIFQIGAITDGFYICEGFATGVSLHDFSDEAVFVAFDCNGLLPAGMSLRLRYPRAEIVFMADDDFQTPGNPGIKKAKLAASQIDAKVRVPRFGNTRPKSATDFNDFVRLKS